MYLLRKVRLWILQDVFKISKSDLKQDQRVLDLESSLKSNLSEIISELRVKSTSDDTYVSVSVSLVEYKKGILDDLKYTVQVQSLNKIVSSYFLDNPSLENLLSQI